MKKVIDWIKSNRLLTAGIILGLIILFIIWIKNKNNKTSPGVEGGIRNLAKCLSDKGVKYYGSATCPKCAQQNQMFGSSKGDLPYVECSSAEGSKECQKQNVKGYPTWKFQDGTELMGVRSLKELQLKAGC